jgi:5'-nucleotidase
MVKRLIACAALGVVALAAPAAAQQYPPAINSLTVSDTTPTPGQTITIEARTCEPGSTVTFSLSSVPVTLASAIADGAGVATVQATIPTDTPLGAHTITATCPAPDGSTLTVSLAITVVPAAGAATGSGSGTGALPRTGQDSSLPLARIGLGLAAIGGVLTAVAAKRRKSAAHVTAS